MTTIQQSAPLVRLDRIVFSCCGWGGGDAIGSNNDNNLGGNNDNKQMTGVMVMMATRQLRGDDDVNNVRPHLPSTQQPAIGWGWGWGGGNKDDERKSTMDVGRWWARWHWLQQRGGGDVIVSCFVPPPLPSIDPTSLSLPSCPPLLGLVGLQGRGQDDAVDVDPRGNDDNSTTISPPCPPR